MPSGADGVAAQRGIGILAKDPSSGTMKTRLSPALTTEQIAELYRAFLRDTLMLADRLRDTIALAVYPPGSDLMQLTDISPTGVEACIESGETFTDILLNTTTLLQARGAQRVALLGTDSPALPLATIEQAFVSLDAANCDVVLVPASDGGYCLIAFEGSHPELFRDIDWSTDRVLAQTLARAGEHGLQTILFDEWYDVDTGDDLARLVRDLMLDGTLYAPATRACLRALREAGVLADDLTRPWRLLERRTDLETPWRSVITDRVQTHSGDQLDYTYFTAPESVVVVPVTPDGEIVLICQYRQPLGDWSFEIPAGTGPGSREDVVGLELREEIGGVAGEVYYLGAFHPVTGHSQLRVHFYVALNVEIGEQNLEPNELIVPVRVPARQALSMARQGLITDGTCALAILLSEPYIGARQ